jgi:TatA/E family protein of Tat protein translocase
MNQFFNSSVRALGKLEVIVIAILAVILFGAKKLPSFARNLGRSNKTKGDLGKAPV